MTQYIPAILPICSKDFFLIINSEKTGSIPVRDINKEILQVAKTTTLPIAGCR